MTSPTLLTVILNYRTAPLTLRAADAALRDMEGIAGGLVIVDNDSRDGSFRMLSDAVRDRGWDADGRVRVIQAGVNGGFGAGNNVGIRAGLSDGTPPDFIYVLNSDAFPDRGAIRVLMEFLRDHPRAGFVGSHVRGEDDVPHPTLFRFPSIAGEFESAARFGPITRLLKNATVRLPIPDTPRQIDWSAGASLMIRRAALDEIGLFDEGFFLYFEETDLCRRAAAAGWERWYHPDSRVVHIGSVSTGMNKWDRVPTYFLDSRTRYFTKTHGRAYAAMATLGLVAGGTLWRLRCLLTNRAVGAPRWFLRDLIAHAWRTGFALPRLPLPPARTLREDSE
ncbi:glycosyltransferase family 2 protein [Oceaniglobus indicus]|uniref:glycosyltransferase family 2 protein n=1 Tax=Oceaniglobus indicus TaxID=2047749 RepID=UPI000C17C4C3|nr:glycosyltransferase family 2 protein [Oceaniglobus indicus]